MIGKTLGNFCVVEKIGHGGMGEVWLAEDLSLGRKVALKFLPDSFAGDPERLARFEREARLLASLNHPNIAAIYGLEQHEGKRFLVLELVEGETLAQRILTSPLPIEEALDVCRQIAEGVEAAHEKGVIHRDLKCANVKITPAGKVKVLDFGLAKAMADDTRDVASSQSPTLTEAMTRPGMILGTAAYMSPEQARGKAVDKRGDIWAFGCILYECLTGKKAFQGETVTETLAAILRTEPDWQILPANIPLQLQELLRRCLQKDARKRTHDIADLRIEIEELIANSQLRTFSAVESPVASGTRFRWQGLMLSLAVAIVLSAVIGIVEWTLLQSRALPAIQTRARAAIRLGPELYGNMTYGSVALAISPDGRYVAYIASRNDTTQLFIRPIDQFTAQPLDGTNGARNAFFSPDGKWIAFGANGKLMKVAVTGGSPIALCEAPNLVSATWGADNRIAFTPRWHSGLFTVSAEGGLPNLLTKADAVRLTHLHPQFLPGGKGILFTAQLGDIRSFDDAEIDVQVFGESRPRTLLRGGTFARYVPTGHLIYARNGTLLAVPFDLKRLQVTGPPVTVLNNVVTSPNTGVVHAALSDTGTLVFVSGGSFKPDRFPANVDRAGSVQPLTDERALFTEMRVSPDGEKVALSVVAGNDDLWILNRQQKTMTRFTYASGDDRFPIWTPDGKRIVYSGGLEKGYNLYWKDAQGIGDPELLLPSDNVQMPSSISPDGKLLAFVEMNPSTLYDIWLLPLQGDRKPQPFAVTPFKEYGPRFSPDGRWIAYASNESGRDEIYVQSVQKGGGKHRISTDGGIWPVWSPDSRELFFLEGKKLMAGKIDVNSGKPLPATPLFMVANLFLGTGSSPYDVTSDGRSFVMILQNDAPPPEHFNVIFNWMEELRQRVHLK